MSLGKSVTAVVSKPDIISLVDKSKWRSKFCVINNPKIHIAQVTVHHQNCGLLNRIAKFLKCAWNAIDLAHVAICSNYCVRLNSVAILDRNLLKRLMSIFCEYCRGQGE